MIITHLSTSNVNESYLKQYKDTCIDVSNRNLSKSESKLKNHLFEAKKLTHFSSH